MKRAAWNASNNTSIKEIDDDFFLLLLHHRVGKERKIDDFKPAFNNASSNCDYKEKFEQKYKKKNVTILISKRHEKWDLMKLKQHEIMTESSNINVGILWWSHCI